MLAFIIIIILNAIKREANYFIAKGEICRRKIPKKVGTIHIDLNIHAIKSNP